MLITLTTWIDRANRVLTVIASSVIAFMCVSSLADAVGRSLRHPIFGLFELNELLLVAVVFLGLGAAQWTGSHIAVDVVSRSLPRRVRLVFETVTLGAGFHDNDRVGVWYDTAGAAFMGDPRVRRRRRLVSALLVEDDHTDRLRLSGLCARGTIGWQDKPTSWSSADKDVTRRGRAFGRRLLSVDVNFERCRRATIAAVFHSTGCRYQR